MNDYHTKQRRAWIGSIHEGRLIRVALAALLLAVLIVGWCEW